MKWLLFSAIAFLNQILFQSVISFQNNEGSAPQTAVGNGSHVCFKTRQQLILNVLKYQEAVEKRVFL